MSEVSLPAGFLASGLHSGIKRSGQPDLGLLVCQQPAVLAAVFTTNRVQAAPVKLNRRRLEHERARAVVVNSGNANACTGERGLRDAEQMAVLTAQALGVEPEEVLVCSTGVIGRFLPMDVIARGIVEAAGRLSPEGGADFARAILTTDTRSKIAERIVEIDNRRVRITGIAKGAGMIAPHMATMLAFITTDAAVEVQYLRAVLSQVVSRTFNRITVDGDQSTNDTVIALASGRAGNQPIAATSPQAEIFASALEEVCRELALMIVRDGEGAQKLVTVTVQGAASAEDAEKAVRAVAESFLVKASWAGRKANWGRIMDALGYSGAEVSEEKVDIYYDGVTAVSGGTASDTPVEKLQEIIQQPEFTVLIKLNLGPHSATLYTCDLTEAYVRINM